MSSTQIKNALGLDISDRALRVVKIQKYGRKLMVRSYNELDLPVNVITNGEINDKKKLIEALNSLINKVKGHKITTKNTITVLPESKTFIKVVDVASTNSDELPNLIKEELKNHIPLESEEIYFDWQIIKSNPQTTKILVGAAPKKIVDSYFSTLEEAGLSPVVLEIEAAAIIRSLLDQKDKNSKIIIDFGAARTGLIVYDQGTVQFTVSLPISGNKITETIAQTLEIDPEKAEKAKLVCGLDHDKCEGAILKILMDSIKNLTTQIKKTILFYKTNFPGGNEISEIILCGGGANFSKIDKILSDDLKLDIKIGNPLKNIVWDEKNSPKNKILSFTTAIGLGLRIFEKEKKI